VELQAFGQGLLDARQAKNTTDADALVAALTDALSWLQISGPYARTVDQRIALRSAGRD
jgi:hypothetical protein